MRKLSRILIVFLLAISGTLIAPSANAAQVTIKNLYFSLTYPSVVKMPKGDCGSFKVSYKLGIKAKQVGYGMVTAIVIVGSDTAAGSYWTLKLGSIGTPLKANGTANWKFCKNDWLDDEDNARIGLNPGTYDIGFVSEFGNDYQEKGGKIKFVK